VGGWGWACCNWRRAAIRCLQKEVPLISLGSHGLVDVLVGGRLVFNRDSSLCPARSLSLPSRARRPLSTSDAAPSPQAKPASLSPPQPLLSTEPLEARPRPASGVLRLRLIEGAFVTTTTTTTTASSSLIITIIAE